MEFDLTHGWRVTRKGGGIDFQNMGMNEKFVVPRFRYGIE
jgi:hypothetical protein